MALPLAEVTVARPITMLNKYHKKRRVLMLLVAPRYRKDQASDKILSLRFDDHLYKVKITETPYIISK